MSGLDLALSSVRRRVKAMHSLWREAAASQSIEHVNHFERDGVLPIAFSLNHCVRLEDQTVQQLFKTSPPIWITGQWAERVGVTVDEAGKEQSVAEMQSLRFTDYDAFKTYMGEVFDSTQKWLDTLEPPDLERVLFGGAKPEVFSKTYSARVVGEGPYTLLDGIECWIFQHGIRHLGEMEHARALVGLGGLTS